MPPLYLCIHLRDFATLALTAFASEGVPPFCQKQANVGRQIESASHLGERAAIVVLSGEPPLERVFALNSAARERGVLCGMSRLQAESFEAILLRRDLPQEEFAFVALMRCAERFSPRIELLASPQPEGCGASLLLDVSGSGRLLGSPEQIAATVHRAVCDVVYRAPHGCASASEISVCVAHNACTAWLAARGLPGAIAIARGHESEALAPLPIAVLEPDPEQTETLAAWGIRSLGQFAALEPRAVAARLGQSGLWLHRQARGEYEHFLIPRQQPADAPLCADIELEHPVELLEPLLFLLNQLLDEVMSRAAERALAIASVEVTLVFDSATTASEDHRTVRPALPERERLALLKLLQLELEMRPPASAVKSLHIIADPAPPQIAQHGLFAAQAPEPGRLQILLARLRKLAGNGLPKLRASGRWGIDRVGSPELLDSRAPEAFRMTSFSPDHKPTHLSRKSGGEDGASATDDSIRSHAPAMRVLRPPREVTVELHDGAPTVLRDQGQQRIVQASSGPWRSNGAWWAQPAWCREEWEVCVEEVSVEDAVIPCCLRLAHDLESKAWYLVGVYD